MRATNPGRDLPAGGWVWWVTNAVLCGLIGLLSLRYLAGVGPVPELIAANHFKNPWLVLHVGCAATALLVGPLQLLPSLRRRAPGFHRGLGRVYVFGCLFGGVAGLALALGSAAGPIATAGFGGLALAWLITTALAWRFAMRRRFVEHKAWMLRSFALTNAAVTLRIYLLILPSLPFAFVSGYRVVSFLCWVPNLLVAEFLLRRGRDKSAFAAAA